MASRRKPLVSVLLLSGSGASGLLHQQRWASLAWVNPPLPNRYGAVHKPRRYSTKKHSTNNNVGDVIKADLGNAADERKKQQRRGLTRFNSLLDSLARKGSSKSAEKAERILFDRIRNVDNGIDGQVSCDIISFNTVLNAWAKCGQAERAATLLSRMEYMAEGGILPFQPNRISFTSVVDAWTHSDDENSFIEAEKLLRRIEETSGGEADSAERDIVQFNMELDMLARKGAAASAEKAERLLFDRLRSVMGEDVCDEASCDIISFNTVLNAWAKCGQAERAAALLSRMEYMSERGILPFQSNSVSFSTVIDAWARSSSKEAPLEAEKLLEQVEETYTEECKHPMGGRVPAPTIHMFSSCINAWAHSGKRGSAHRAERLLKRLEDMHAAQQDRDIIVGKRLDIKPNAIIYTSVINCLAKSKEKGSALRAEILFRKMLEMHQSGNDTMKPSLVTYATVINAWASSGEGSHAAARADELLFLCESDSIGPNVFVYTNAIKAWARSGHPESGVRSEAILKRMIGSDNADARPNAITMTAVIDAWIKQGDRVTAPHHAERLLRKMEDLYEEGNDDMKPDAFVYSMIIKAWKRSPEAFASERAEATRRRMEEKKNSGRRRRMKR